MRGRGNDRLHVWTALRATHGGVTPPEKDVEKFRRQGLWKSLELLRSEYPPFPVAHVRSLSGTRDSLND